MRGAKGALGRRGMLKVRGAMTWRLRGGEGSGGEVISLEGVGVSPAVCPKWWLETRLGEARR
jgi:hypothetical protein